MKSSFCRLTALFVVYLLGTAWLAASTRPLAFEEQRFDSLEIGTRMYRNVTVTTKTTNYVFLVHAEGMTNIKVAELTPDAREKLGYTDPTARKVSTNSPAAWAKQTVGKLEVPEIKKVEEQLTKKWSSSAVGAKFPLPRITPNLLYACAGILFACYVFHCFCCLLICTKAGAKPGILIWIPVLQLLPLLKAARMSGWWFAAYLLPVLNVVAQVMWCFRIAEARGKSALTAVLLLLPITSLFAFLYLAFSDGTGSGSGDRRKRIEILTLETA